MKPSKRVLINGWGGWQTEDVGACSENPGDNVIHNARRQQAMNYGYGQVQLAGCFLQALYKTTEVRGYSGQSCRPLWGA